MEWNYAVFLQCFDNVGWVIWPVEKPSPIGLWPIMCLVGR